jgi:hypothetical protein
MVDGHGHFAAIGTGVAMARILSGREQFHSRDPTNRWQANLISGAMLILVAIYEHVISRARWTFHEAADPKTLKTDGL